MRPKPARPSEVARWLASLGFQEVRRKGSNRFYRHSDGRITTVSFHPGDVPTGTLRKIIAQVGRTVEEFNESV